MNDQIHTYKIGGASYAVVSTGGPNEIGSHNVLMEDGEDARQALHRCATEYRAKAARLTSWAERLENALKSTR